MASTQLSITGSLLLVYVLMISGGASGSRILLLSPQFFSHVYMQMSVGEVLVRRGHEVYVGLGSKFTKLQLVERLGIRPLFFHIPPDALYWSSDEYERLLADSIFNNTEDDPVLNQINSDMSKMAYRDCELMLTDERFMKQARMLKFDMAVVEPFLAGPCSLAIAHVLQIPFVQMALHYFPWTQRIPAFPSFFTIPFAFKTNIRPTTFFDSISNAALYIVGKFHILPLFQNDTFRERYIPEVSSWNDLLRAGELFLMETSLYFDSVIPSFPNFISVAGYTTKPPGKLSGDLAEIYERSDSGVILTSFGSTAYYMPEEIVRKFLDAFARLNQTVIAKFGVPEGVPVPPNVHLTSWLPQNDILGHPKTLLFITHCGSNGQHEALYNAVPMLGFPMFADQSYNCHRAVQKGYGLCMDVHSFGVDQLVENIQELLENATYRTTIKRASEIWHSEPMNGREKAAFWIDHVIKYGGEHLRSTAMDMPLYRFLMLDVFAVALLATLVAFVLVFGVLRCLMKTVCSRDSQRIAPKGYDSRKKLS